MQKQITLIRFQSGGIKKDKEREFLNRRLNHGLPRQSKLARDSEIRARRELLPRAFTFERAVRFVESAGVDLA